MRVFLECTLQKRERESCHGRDDIKNEMAGEMLVEAFSESNTPCEILKEGRKNERLHSETAPVPCLGIPFPSLGKTFSTSGWSNFQSGNRVLESRKRHFLA